MAGKICSVYGCINYENSKCSGKSFFRFPRNLKLCKIWVVMCKSQGLDDILQKHGPCLLNKNYRVCSDHFAEKDFRNKNLLSQGIYKESIPSLNLPGIVKSVVPRQSNEKTDEEVDVQIKIETITNEDDVAFDKAPPVVNQAKTVCTHDVEVAFDKAPSVSQAKTVCTHDVASLKRKLKNAQKTISKYRILVRKLRNEVKEYKTAVNPALMRFLKDCKNKQINVFALRQMKNYKRNN